MQSLMELKQSAVQEPVLLGMLTDYKSLCAPHVPSIREVLEGTRCRYKIRFNGALFVFHHGCLMAQVVHDGMIRALPAFALDAEGMPYVRALPEHQQHWLDEFMGLPKSLLLFYFGLLKEVFKGYALACRWQDPETGRLVPVSMPESLCPMLAEVGWHTR